MLFLLLWLLIFAKDLFASGYPYINKFSSFSTSDWVEVCAPDGNPVNMADYAIEDLAKNRNKGIDCLISGGSCFIFDLGRDLNNSGDIIYLMRGEEQVDCVSYGDKPCIENTPSDFEKLGEGEYGIKINESWIITDDPSRSENICLGPTATPSNTPSPSLTPSTTLVLVQNYDIIISEVYPNPSQGYEWVELYNNSGQEAVLADWKIDDQDGGGSSPYSFNITIGGDSYIVIEIQKAGGMLNDSGDDVRLLDNQGNLIDNLSYGQIDKGISYSLVGENYCFSLATPETDNFDCFEDEGSQEIALATLTPSPTLKPTDKIKNSPTLSPKPTNNKDQEATQSSEINVKDIILSENENGEVKGEKRENIKNSPDINNKNAFITLIFIGLGTSILGAYYMLSKNEKNSFTNN